MGNINFELPCADRKTREKKFLNKYDRKSIFNTNNDLPPRNTKQLNELEKYINFHETQTKKNSYIIENAKFHSGIGLNNDPSSTFDSNTNDNEGLKVSYVMEYSITELLNKSLKMNKVLFVFILTIVFLLELIYSNIYFPQSHQTESNSYYISTFGYNRKYRSKLE